MKMRTVNRMVTKFAALRVIYVLFLSCFNQIMINPEINCLSLCFNDHDDDLNQFISS